MTNDKFNLQDQHILNRSKSHNEASDYPSVMLVQKKEYWYKVTIETVVGIIECKYKLQTSPKERRKYFDKIRRSQSMDVDDHSTTSEDSEPRVYKLLSETDIQVNCQTIKGIPTIVSLFRIQD